MPELIDYQTAQELKKKHKQSGSQNDMIAATLSGIKHQTAAESNFDRLLKLTTI
jgi:purine nucleoside phosphorylase